MAAVNEVIGVFHSVRDIVSNIENIREDWFTATVEYQTEASILRSRLSSYEKQVRSHQQPADSTTMMKILKKAESTLKRAEARLNRLEESVNSDHCCSQIWWLYAKLSMTVMPEKLENTLKKVNEDLDRIPRILKDEMEVSGIMQEADKNLPMSSDFYDNDKRYVPIEESQAEVIKAIEDAKGPPMILLYGGVGKGKSTLARYMCKRYGKSGEKKNLFDHVIVVSCGNTSISDLATKQYEILEHLSPSSLTEQSSLKSAEKIGSKSRIAKALHHLLLGKKILMILDNISDKDFLYKMWEVARDGKDDKILITSQKSNLCADVKDDSVVVAMAKPTEEEARKILASLVGLENQTVPPHLQGIADKMIQATDRNPLALACLASTFSYSQNKQDQSEWQDAWDELSVQLDNPETTIVLGRNDQTAPRSLWKTMELCLDSLETKHAKSTLFLMYACKGESVPEEVLRILCAGMKIGRSAFNRSKNELWMRDLLKPPADTLGSSQMNLIEERNEEEFQKSPAWSLHSLVKLYMERHVAGKQDIREAIGGLLGDDHLSIKCKQDCEVEIAENDIEIVESDEMRVRIVLCALYFDRQHTDQAVSRAVTKACQLSNLVDSDETINDLRRKCISPLVWLLDKREGEGWTGMDKWRVRKVLLAFICKRQLDNENISYLLKLAAYPSAQLATLLAITHILTIEETLLLNENTIGILQAVVDLLNLEEDSRIRVQEAASRALRAVCWKAVNDKSATLVANMLGALDVFVQLLAIPTWKSDAIAVNAAFALKALARSEEKDIQKILVNKQGIVASLVNCLYQHSKPRLQAAAAAALSNLGRPNDNGLDLRIANEEGALVGLVNCLSAHDQRDLQRQAAWALANLAASNDNALKLRIANEEGALVGLANCLSAHDHHGLQEQAARAFASLAWSDDALKSRIANEEGALAGLLNCLFAHDHLNLQRLAARALADLARGSNAKAILKGMEGLLEGLTSMVGDNVCADTRSSVVEALFRIDPTLAKEVGLLSAQLPVGALSYRIFVKAKSGDFQGALDDANEAITMSDGERAFILQERGVLKRMIGDLEGALADLDEGLELYTYDYDVLKHRGYVKFLLDDVEGARADAECALTIQPSRVENHEYYLGGTPAEYLGYKL